MTCRCDPPCILQRIAAMNEERLRESLLNTSEELDMARAYIDELWSGPWPPLKLAFGRAVHRVRDTLTGTKGGAS